VGAETREVGHGGDIAGIREAAKEEGIGEGIERGW